MDKEILKFGMERGFLLDKDVLKLLGEVGDIESVKLILENIKKYSETKIITREILVHNAGRVSNLLLSLPETARQKFEKLKIKLGLEIEISKEIVGTPAEIGPIRKADNLNPVKILSVPPSHAKKIVVSDFVDYFRGRFSKMKSILQENPNLPNLISIDKIYGNRQGISIIGMISSKRMTKNKNLLFEIEDLTGKIRVVVNSNKPEVYKKAENISLDSVLGFRGSGSREILFVNDIIFPDSVLHEKKNAPAEEYALFIGDLHFGSKRFLKKGFLKFIDFLNGKLLGTSEVGKIKYLFIVGDLVTGIGNYPSQERDLEILNLEDQYLQVAELLRQIRKDITIIVSPGNHDGVRLMEPQPLLDEKYAWPLYNLKNLIFTGNPATVNIAARKNFPGFNVLTYHGFSYQFYANNVPYLVSKKAMNVPEEIMKYLLKNRHLAPAHTSVQYFPMEEDALMIKIIPDIFVSGHTHKSGVSYHNNILVISASCWESMTPYQEKFGNEPDHCKVPMLNLKTREIKILDFEGEEESKEEVREVKVDGK